MFTHLTTFTHLTAPNTHQLRTCNKSDAKQAHTDKLIDNSNPFPDFATTVGLPEDALKFRLLDTNGHLHPHISQLSSLQYQTCYLNQQLAPAVTPNRYLLTNLSTLMARFCHSPSVCQEACSTVTLLDTNGHLHSHISHPSFIQH